MISSVTKDIGGASRTFRLTTRAIMALEDRFDTGIVQFMARLKNDFRLGQVVAFLAECSNDGAGADISVAQKLVDALGFTGASDLMGEIAEKAFPEAVGADAKNPKRAGQ